MTWLMNRLQRAWNEIFADSIDCPKCKGQAPFTDTWGRFSLYECARCGTMTKVKCYD